MLTSICEAKAQSVSTVREAEFRSRWTDYQVDKLKAKNEETTNETLPTDFIARFTQFGPLEFHGGLTTGWEYSNEIDQRETQKESSTSSFFLAPSLVAIYEKEIGTWNLSASYSVGWLYYLDPDYRGSDGGLTTSQTANLNLLRVNDRITIRSLTNASSGTGYDIERSATTDRISASQSFSVEYQLTEYLRTGVSGSWSFEDNSTPDSSLGNADSTNYRYSGAAFVDNFWTDKTAYRIELSAGSDHQENVASTGIERSYAQSVIRVNYGPTSKLAFTASAGLGVRDVAGSSQDDGLRAVYSLSSTYTPSEKTTARAYVGVEGASSQTEFTFTLSWHPREFTFFDLSIYQQAGLANFATTDERISKGFLATFRQRLFRKVDASLSGGYEESASVIEDAAAADEQPYYFMALGVGWQLNRSLIFQGQLRTSTRRNTLNQNDEGLQTRASLSLGLTF